MTAPTKLYLSGPMTGHKDLNFPAFHAAAAKLRHAGYEVINPAEINQADQSNWLACMWNDIEAMARERVDGIATLPEWMNSRGARVECQLAFGLALPVWDVRVWVDMARAKAALNMPETDDERAN
jgi:hypothetical protein